MKTKTLISVNIIGVACFAFGWFLHKPSAVSIDQALTEKTDSSISKADSAHSSTSIIDSAKNTFDSTEDFSNKLHGRFIMKGTNYAGYDFIGHGVVLWTNESFPEMPDSLRVRWIDHNTFCTKDIERINQDCPPRVYIEQVLSFDGNTLWLKDIWTGWGNYTDDKTEYIRVKNN